MKDMYRRSLLLLLLVLLRWAHMVQAYQKCCPLDQIIHTTRYRMLLLGVPHVVQAYQKCCPLDQVFTLPGIE